MAALISTHFTLLPNGASPTGNVMASLEFDVLQDDVVSVDVNNGQPGQSLARVESLYVDNTRGAGALVFVFADATRLLIVPPGAEGCYPTYSAATYFRVAQRGAKKGVYARIKAFACLKLYYERFPGAQGLLQNPLDVNNGPNGVIPPPVVSGWSQKAISPVVTFPTYNRVVIAGVVGSALTIPWANALNLVTAGKGGRYYELTYENVAAFDGIGFAATSEEIGNQTQFKNIRVVSNRVVYNLYAAADEYGIAQDPANPKTFGFNVDFYNKAISIIGANGFLATPTHNGTGNAFGINLNGFDLSGSISDSLWAPAIMFNGGNGNTGCTCNTVGPFLYPIPGGSIAWDAGL